MIIDNRVEYGSIEHLKTQLKLNESYRLEYYAQSKLKQMLTKYKEPEQFTCNPKEAIDAGTKLERLEKLLQTNSLRRAELIPSRTRKYDLAYYYNDADGTMKCDSIYEVQTKIEDNCTEPTIEARWSEDKSYIYIKVGLPRQYANVLSSNMNSTYTNPRPIQIYPTNKT